MDHSLLKSLIVLTALVVVSVWLVFGQRMQTPVTTMLARWFALPVFLGLLVGGYLFWISTLAEALAVTERRTMEGADAVKMVGCDVSNPNPERRRCSLCHEDFAASALLLND